MHSLAPNMGTTSVFIKTLTKTHWGKWRLLGEGRTSRPKAKSGVGFLGREQQALLARGSGEHCELSNRVRGGALTAQRFLKTIFSTQDGLSWHYNIVLLWITKKWKILNPFNLESIIAVHLVMLFDVLVYETKFTVGKWQVVVSSLQERGEVDGGNPTLGGIPPSSAELRPHWPWRTREIRGPWCYLKS